MKQTAIVILNWNGRNLLEQFLPALLSYTPPDEADVIVADNGSTDDSLAFLQYYFPDIEVIPLDRNYGFAEGYNRALQHLRHKYVVLLNSDVEVTPDWLTPAIDYLEQHESVVALQPKILSYNESSKFEYAGAAGGFIDKYGYPFCRGRIFGTIETDYGQYDTVTPVFWTSGACMFIRLSEFFDAGGFDANFFAHQEEIDLCWRLNARGKTLVCFPQSIVYHVGGGTLDKENPRKTYLNFRNNLLMLYKNLPKRYKRTMIMRFVLDYLAALHFILKGKPDNATAVRRARHDFCQLKKDYKSIREYNLAQTTDNNPPGLVNKNLIKEYYLGKKKHFDQL